MRSCVLGTVLRIRGRTGWGGTQAGGARPQIVDLTGAAAVSPGHPRESWEGFSAVRQGVVPW